MRAGVGGRRRDVWEERESEVLAGLVFVLLGGELDWNGGGVSGFELGFVGSVALVSLLELAHAAEAVDVLFSIGLEQEDRLEGLGELLGLGVDGWDGAAGEGGKVG